MEPRFRIESSLRYGRTLLDRGISGLRDGSESYLKGRSLLPVVYQSARDSVALASLGALACVLPLCVASPRGRGKKSLVYALAGSALGFVAGFTWSTRALTAGMTRSAWKQINEVRDQHWLQEHPIDYA